MSTTLYRLIATSSLDGALVSELLHIATHFVRKFDISNTEDMLEESDAEKDVHASTPLSTFALSEIDSLEYAASQIFWKAQARALSSVLIGKEDAWLMVNGRVSMWSLLRCQYPCTSTAR